MYIDSLTIENFRCFEKASLTLNHPARQYTGTPPRLNNVNLFLGENGSGKSSIFKATVLSILAPIIQDSGFKPEYLVRRTKTTSSDELPRAIIGASLLDEIGELPLLQEAHVYLYGDNESIPRTNFPAAFRQMMGSDDSPEFFCAGYGASRRTERPEGYSERNRILRYQRVAGLFEDHVGLVPITYAALQLQKRNRFDEARALLNALLPLDVQLTSNSDSLDNPLFDAGGIDLPSNALSDGFRTFVGWVWDLLVQLARVCPEDKRLVDLTGVVIVDEIDLFLHPKWQREVVEQVATTFPNLQFLFSTHSPIVATTLEPANIFLTENGKIEQFEESISGKSIDEALTSSYFGLASPRSPELERELGQLAEQAMNGDFAASLEYLRRLRTGTETTNGKVTR